MRTQHSRRNGVRRLATAWLALRVGIGIVTTARGEDPAAGAGAFPPGALEFFEARVRPILAEKCLGCHGAKKQSSELRLDSRAAAIAGGANGPALVSGRPDESLMIQAVRRTHDEIKMPPKGKLPDAAIDALSQWVAMGAPWSEGTIPTAEARDRAGQEHWAFRPVREVAPPAIKGGANGADASPIDAFILDRLAREGLTLSPRADRRTLIRRATFDLTGLPPTPAEVAAFEADPAPAAAAFAAVVDRLLASPAYGERWGRYWLDVARYGDSKGYVAGKEERRYPYAYTYRDYVIRSFNEDKPYDRFLVEQVAADRLGRLDDRRDLAALGFLTVGRRFLNDRNEIIDDRIDVVCRGLLGLTVACARCHDHKFDPIPTDDYYSLYGVFASTVEPEDLPLIGAKAPGAASADYERQLREHSEARDAFLARHRDEIQDELPKLQARIAELQVTHPGAPPRAMVVNDAPKPTDPRVFIRGNPGRPGKAVPRRFLEVLSGPDRKPFADGGGRLDLARAIARPDNPLTARVLVNRLWLNHFGAGLVDTPSDFGLRSDLPTHPELLDYLAAEFVRGGWSIKAMHRKIMLTAVYQQRSDNRPEGLARDPQNRLLWKFNRRRLDFEATRDAFLAVSGGLDPTLGGRSVVLTTAPFTGRRTVYGLVDRQSLDGLYRTFDFASPDATSPQRYVTTVPQQALFLMNSSFVVERSRRLVERLESAPADPEARVRQLYRVLFGRAPEPHELELGIAFAGRPSPNMGNASSDIQGPPPPTLTPWEAYAQVLLLTNEFAFVD